MSYADRGSPASRHALDRLTEAVGALERRVAAVEPRLAALEHSLAALHARQSVYLGDHEALTLTHHGQMIFVDTRDAGIAAHILMKGHWESHVEVVLAGLLRPGMRFCDVGANFGYFTLLAGAMVGPAGRVDAFEPNPGMMRKLRRTIAINGLGGVVALHEAAVADHAGEAVLRFVPEFSGSGGIVGAGSFAGFAEQAVTVRTLRLDDALADAPALDVLKLDAEGAEPMILAGAQAIIARSPQLAIVMEFQADMAFDGGAAACLEAMQAQGFSLAVIEPHGPVPYTDATALLARAAHGLHYLLLRRAP
jgi:FkbM family methyltransferase